MSALSPDLEESVPGTGAEGGSININAEARNTVVVALEGEDELSLESIPDAAVVVIITSEEESAGDGEGNGGNTNEDAVGAVVHELTVSTEVPETAAGVISTSGKAKSVGHDLNGVDITLVSSEGLSGLAGTDIPVLGVGIDSTRDEGGAVGEEGESHDITVVTLELTDLDTTLDIPEHAAGITRAGHNLLVVDETAAGEVSSVGVELTADTDGELLGLKVVDGADVVETTASNEVVRWSVGAGHDPGRTERDSVGLVGGEGVPDKELAVL